MVKIKRDVNNKEKVGFIDKNKYNNKDKEKKKPIIITRKLVIILLVALNFTRDRIEKKQLTSQIKYIQ